MRVTLPLLRIQPARAPILRYGVAVLSTTLALIPAVLLPNITESRLAVFAVAVMVSAWYGGWKPGLVATSFALTVSAYFSFSGERTPAQFRSTMMRLALFVVLAALICWFNAALRATQEGLRRSEMNFRSLVTNAPYGICRCDSTGQLLDVNPALLAMLGYSSARDLVGTHLGASTQIRYQWFELADYLRSAAPFNGLIAEWKRKDGLGTVVRVSGRAVSYGDKERAFELFAEDVTERRALEQQLQQSQKMEAVGRLAGGIAHDFNNLLMVISGYSEFLLDRLGPDPALRGPAQEIAGASQRASSLTRQLLAFSRKQMLAPKILDLNDVVTENLKMLTRVIGEDIDLVMVPAAVLGVGACRRGTDRSGHHESRGERTRCHALRRQAHHRDLQRLARRGVRPFSCSTPARRLRDALHQRHRPGHGFRNSVPYLRALLHHQRNEGHRAGALHGLRNRQAEWRLHLGLQRVRQRHHVQDLFAARRGEQPKLSRRSSPPRKPFPPSPERRPFFWQRTKPICATSLASSWKSRATK